MTSSWCFYCQLCTYITPFSNISIGDFEQVNVSLVGFLKNLKEPNYLLQQSNSTDLQEVFVRSHQERVEDFMNNSILFRFLTKSK